MRKSRKYTKRRRIRKKSRKMRRRGGGSPTSKVKQSPRRNKEKSVEKSIEKSVEKSIRGSAKKSPRGNKEKSTRSSLYSTNALDAITASRNREKNRKGYEQLLQAAKYIKNQSNPIKEE